jgi:hypothetical protein
MKVLCQYFVFMLGYNPTHMGGLDLFSLYPSYFCGEGLKPTKLQLHELFTIPPKKLVESMILAFQTNYFL